MTLPLILIVILAIFLTVLTFWKPNYILAFISAGSWVALLAYTRSNHLYGMAPGSTNDEFLVIICLAMAIAMPLTTFFRMRDSNRAEAKLTSNPLQSFREERQTRHGSSGRFAESSEEYQARVRAILRHKPRR